MIRIIEAKNDFNLFVQARAEVVALYNETSKFHHEKVFAELSDYTDMEGCFVIKKDNIKGGIYIENLLGIPHLAVICFTALEESARGKGIFNSLFEAAFEFCLKKNNYLAAVQLNTFDNRALWNHYGFVEERQLLNGAPILINLELLKYFSSGGRSEN